VFKEFETALDTMLSDKQKHDSLGNAGYEHILSHHNWDQIKKQYKTLFEM
jgi:glycosyltransferase involved in cell wall biosynthesis